MTKCSKVMTVFVVQKNCFFLETQWGNGNRVNYSSMFSVHVYVEGN